MKIALIFALLVGCATAVPTASKGPARIVGGEEAVPNEFPWQLSLQYYGSHICGATIYNELTVITAAHCIVTDDYTALTVKAGKHHLFELEATEQTRHVSTVARHIQYPGDSGFSHDIAVLGLTEPLVFSDAVAPIQIAPSLHTIEPNTPVTITGWGAQREGGSLPERLRKVNIPVISDIDCRTVYLDTFEGNNMICTLEPQGGKDSCTGDSGGPMVANDLGPEVGWYLAGITSWGYGCARPGYPGVYTEISRFVDFIEVNASH